MQKKASQAVQQGASHRIQIQKNIVAIIAVVVVMMMFWLSAVPALNWFERSGKAEELRDARTLWLTSNVGDYEFNYKISCLCDDSTENPVAVVVRDHEFVRAYNAESGARLDISASTVIPGTIVDAFDLASRLLNDYPDVFEASYDLSLGYPSVIRVDPEDDLKGDEAGYYLTNFRPLSEEPVGR